MSLKGEFLWKHDMDVALLQELTHNFDNIRGYTATVNEGYDKRGTAITKDGYSTTNVKRLPSGRGNVASFMDTWFIIVYAPSGAGKRNERETFLIDLTYILPTSAIHLILAGD
jgi:hypothetical protein